MTQFNFGPIARTSAGKIDDTINLASFPLHVMLNALVGSTSVEEFIAWLWHDLYKPAFYWVRNGRLSWLHVPGLGAFSQRERKFSQHTNIRGSLVRTHHRFQNKAPHFALHENDFISDQGDQVNLGATVNYIQLSLAAEPALPTLLTRSVIADAFIEVVTKDVANVLREAFEAVGRTPIEQVRFEFETTPNITFSSQPTDDEIWNKVGKHFNVHIDGNRFIMHHLTPIVNLEHESFKTAFTADLTGNPLSPDEMLNNTFSLAELLVLYQDSRTVIIAVPQPKLYKIDESKIQQATFDTSRSRLEQDFKVLTEKDGVDYLASAFDSQIRIREVPGRLNKRPKPKKEGVNDNFRSLNDAVQHPTELLTEARNSSNGRLCCVTGTWFKANLSASTLSAKKSLLKERFVDTEFVSLVEDINQERYLSPLAYLYVINSSGAGKGEETRKAFRGSFAYLAPASHFAIDEHRVKAVEQPILDRGGRFADQLNRITVTTQEFTLFQQMSRRIIAKLWQSIIEDDHLPLPYLGAIALTQESEQRNRINLLLPQLDLLFSEVSLEAYPFKLGAKPAIEIALEVSVHDKQHHHTKHTLLKAMSHTITVEPKSVIPILIDDNVHVNLNEEFFKRVNLLAKLTNDLNRWKKKVNQKDLWLKLVTISSDPVTAVFESAAATIDTRSLPKTLSLETAAFNAANNFWDKHIDTGDFAESWKQYERLNQKATNALEKFPALLLLLQTLQKKDKS